MSGITLRPYQENAITAIETAWDEGLNRPAVVMATGAGKTCVLSDLIRRRIEDLRKNGKRVLVLAHRGELLEQAEAKIKAACPGIWTSVVKAQRGHKTQEFADVVIASVQTLAQPKRREAITRIGMVIADECHHYASDTYKAVLDHYGCTDERAVPTVGFTATLTRMEGGLPEVWQAVVYKKTIHELIEEGYLVPPVTKAIDVPGLNLANAQVMSKAADALMSDTAAFDIIADHWVAQAADRPTLAFLPDTKTCRTLEDALKARGAAAETVIGSTPAKERRAVYSRFEQGVTDVLVSCGTLTEGFDAPHTACVLLARPCVSPGLYVQILGRGLRLHEGKTDCLVLDVAGASRRHTLAGVNDLESDCKSYGSCGCECLLCGCADSCKCWIRKCGCPCVPSHEAGKKDCRCSGTPECGCGCPGGDVPEGLEPCVCAANPQCACGGGGREPSVIAVEDLETLTEIDILGTETAKSGYNWLATEAGILFLSVAPDAYVFTFPAPEGGFFRGLLTGTSPNAPVRRLDDGPLPADEALAALEAYADASGFQYNVKKAAWRRTPASDGQKALLRRLGAEFPEGLSKGAASDLLSFTKVGRVLDPRFGSYLTPAE